MVGEQTEIVNDGVDVAQKQIWIEGPHLFARDGFHYLIAVEGGSSEQHSEVVFRSTALRGPYLPFAGNPILTQQDLDPKRTNPITSAGHAKFVETQDGKWWRPSSRRDPITSSLQYQARNLPSAGRLA
jgi:xylan 1,4-beta-xylosidase